MYDDQLEPTESIPVGRATDLGAALLMPDIDRPRAWLLTLNDSPQSYVDLDDPAHLEFEYTRRLGHVVDLAAEPGEPLAALHLGGGGLTLPRYIAATRPGSLQTVAELDAELVSLVLEHLPMPAGAAIDVVTGDAREELTARPDDSADLIIVDVFGGAQVPAHLTSREFAAEAARVLRQGGVYATNIADGGDLDFARAQVATLRAVFPEVVLIAEPGVLRGRRFGNLVVVASTVGLPVSQLARRTAGDNIPARVLSGIEARVFSRDVAPVTDKTATASPSPPGGTFRIG
ncbi:fused MFS/spermidine synthase [Streptomyces sp. SID3343]|uniref:spermidine synthase n=1 Tax=Streptomyces sp. SID3343 TaxID=2690260 RepID=UPI00136E9789|nr:fused MFS/spermidine synthase [Streptomyces sp. SID3343]MYW02722.1 spermine synthase [Streptomyces sp. SID3343]